jgi:hypothetical protein
VVPIPGIKRRRYPQEHLGSLNLALQPDDLDRLSNLQPAGERYPDMSWVSDVRPLRTAPANFAHRNRPIPWQTSTMNGSSVTRFCGFDQRIRTSGMKLMLNVGDRLLEPHTVNFTLNAVRNAAAVA